MAKMGRPPKDMEKARRFADNLNNILAEENLTQTDVAKALDMTQQTISNWCRGVRMPGEITLRRLAKSVKRSREELITQ